MILSPMARYFEFPSPASFNCFEIVKNEADLKKIIKSEWKKFAPNTKNLFRVYSYHKKSGQTYIRANCYYCRAYLVYEKKNSQDHWKLSKLRSKHNHGVQISKKKTKNSQMQRAFQFCKALRKVDKKEELRELILQKFSISKRNFNTLYQKIGHISEDNQSKVNQIQQTILKIKDTTITTQYSVSGEEIIIITNRKMNEMFESYGDSVCLDFNLEVLKNEGAVTKYRLGFLIGANNKNRLVIFFIILVTKLTAEIYKQLLKTLFVKRQSRVTESIFTRRDQALEQAISRLKQQKQFQISHFYDPYQCPKDQNLGALTQKLIQREIFLRRNEQILRKKNNKLFTYEGHSFVGLGLSSSKSKCLHLKIKRQIPKLLNLQQGIKRVVEICERINLHDSQNNYEQAIYLLPERNSTFLTEIAQKTCKQVFGIFYMEYVQSVKCNIQQTDDNKVIIEEMDCDFENGSVFQVDIPTRNNLKCSCTLKQRIGIPCRHIIKVANRYKIALISQFKRRWIITS